MKSSPLPATGLEDPPSTLAEDVRDPVARNGPLVLLPVRHHSPACAWHTGKTIREYKPTCVLIEGPSDASELLPFVIDPETRPPVAMYGFVRPSGEGPGFACWYPFCEHSPEYVALCAANEVGAAAAFIDIPIWWTARLEGSGRPADSRANLYADRELRFGEVVAQLCQKTGARDFDELWDVFFESDGFERSPERFWSDLASYCRLVRRAAASAGDSDHNRIREAHMAWRIAEAMRRHERVLVVAGGYHRTGLIELLSKGPARPEEPAAPSKEERGCYLVAYTDRQLDRWSGYDAGMPAPGFYRRLWRLMGKAGDADAVDRRFLGEIADHLRDKGESVSTADLIAAERMLRGLARFRGRRVATRDDLKDAIRSTWVKGPMGRSEGLLAAVDRFLIGNKIGFATPKAGSPPILLDFDRQAREHRLPGRPTGLSQRWSGTQAKKTVHLDLYARPAHRPKSAFLHRLRRLAIGYAAFVAGPDFTAGTNLARVRESWEVAWSPAVDAALLEAARLGSTVAEAAAAKLQEEALALADPPSARRAVSLLTAALVMDFPHLAEDFVGRVDAAIDEDGDFAAVAEAFGGLAQLLGYRPILGAERHPAIERLAQRAFARAVWLIEFLPGLPEGVGAERDEMVLSGLARMRHAVLAESIDGIDGERFLDALALVRDRLGPKPLLEGAAVGVLRQAGRVHDADLLAAVENAVRNTVAGPDASLGSFLRGLFTMVRHAVHQGNALIDAISHCLQQLDEEHFRAALPELRWAFTLFPPREIREIAERLSERLGGEAARETLDDVEFARDVDARIGQLLERLEL